MSCLSSSEQASVIDIFQLATALMEMPFMPKPVKHETVLTELTCTGNANVVCKSEISCTQIDNACGVKSEVTCPVYGSSKHNHSKISTDIFQKSATIDASTTCNKRPKHKQSKIATYICNEWFHANMRFTYSTNISTCSCVSVYVYTKTVLNKNKKIIINK